MSKFFYLEELSLESSLLEASTDEFYSEIFSRGLPAIFFIELS